MQIKIPRRDRFIRSSVQTRRAGLGCPGNSYSNTGDMPSALNAYQLGLRFYDSASLYAGLAFIYRAQKDWPAERDALQNQLRLDASDPYTHYRLGLLLTFLAPGTSPHRINLASSLDPETDPRCRH
ncbi:MAG: hypothetical protein IPO22_15910 [Anaerolineales bacterium]|nr:hypothetical protein [Anaerolineales bacterium]